MYAVSIVRVRDRGTCADWGGHSRSTLSGIPFVISERLWTTPPGLACTGPPGIGLGSAAAEAPAHIRASNGSPARPI